MIKKIEFQGLVIDDAFFNIKDFYGTKDSLNITFCVYVSREAFKKKEKSLFIDTISIPMADVSTVLFKKLESLVSAHLDANPAK